MDGNKKGIARGKVKGPLTSRVDREVNFGAPKDVRERGGSGSKGEIVDEVWDRPLDEINSVPIHGSDCAPGIGCCGDYAFCSQLIKWQDGTYSIRLAYYRRRHGEDWWEFGSQMTVNSDRQTVRQLLERTLARAEWFQGDGERR